MDWRLKLQQPDDLGCHRNCPTEIAIGNFLFDTKIRENWVNPALWYYITQYLLLQFGVVDYGTFGGVA